jgi:hypothetical protein
MIPASPRWVRDAAALSARTGRLVAALALALLAVAALTAAIGVVAGRPVARVYLTPEITGTTENPEEPGPQRARRRWR